MKKKSLAAGSILLILLVGGVQVSAIGPLDVYIQAGAMTDESLSFSPFLWTAGVNIDFKVGGMFMLSPELNIVVTEFDFDNILLEPALIANLRFTAFFVGAGLTKFFNLGDEFEFNKFSLKVNGGIKLPGIRLRGYVIIPFDDLFNPVIYGFSVGFGF